MSQLTFLFAFLLYNFSFSFVSVLPAIANTSLIPITLILYPKHYSSFTLSYTLHSEDGLPFTVGLAGPQVYQPNGMYINRTFEAEIRNATDDKHTMLRRNVHSYRQNPLQSKNDFA